MDYFIKSKVLNLDSQTSKILSSLLLNSRHVKLSTQHLKGVVKIYCLKVFSLIKYVQVSEICFMNYNLWEMFDPPPPSHISQVNFLLPLRKPFCFYQAWFLLAAFLGHAHIWCQTLDPDNFHHYLEFSPSCYYLNIFLVQISHTVLCENFIIPPLRDSPWINSHCT